MSGRIVIPIHNQGGALVAYAGRGLDGRAPKYKLPPGFRKGRELFNLHRAVPRAARRPSWWRGTLIACAFIKPGFHGWWL